MPPVETLFSPALLPAKAHEQLRRAITLTVDGDNLQLAGTLRQQAEVAGRLPGGEIEQFQLAVAASLLADLAEQGWQIRVIDRDIMVRAPEGGATQGETVQKVKSRLRNGLMIASDRQLATKAVQDFLQYMERNRSHRSKVISINSVVDDGADLAAKLEKLATVEPSERLRLLEHLIIPVIQLCEPGAVCEFTGYKLIDIWRYFRHTWSLEYNSLPGRTLRILIRNKARKNWPIIGIAMLASPAANLYSRDEWIGWRLDDLITHIIDGSWNAARVTNVLLDTIRTAISEIRTDDLVTKEELEQPTRLTFFRLRQLAARAEAARRNDLAAVDGSKDYIVDIRDFDKERITDADWHRLSSTSLYTKKRAEQLVRLLETLRYFKDADFERAPGAALYEVLVTSRGRSAVAFTLNEIRKRRLATEVADLSVCGAIQPYNHLLGGKLVTLLMASQEVRDKYIARYNDQSSEIASQIAGKAIKRSSDLKIITTTSLYGVGSSQYNRLNLRANSAPGVKFDLRWEELGLTDGVTVTHLSKLTVEYMRQLGMVKYGVRRINSVFGEGSSPRTRQVREGLNLIGINDDKLLTQHVGRRVYACELFPGARQALIGFSAPNKGRARALAAAAITRAWVKRWLSNRIVNTEIIARVRHSDSSSIAEELRDRAARSRLEEVRLPMGPDGDREQEWSGSVIAI